MKYSQILYEVSDRILTITLNRPERLNVFSPVICQELLDAFGRADADDDVRVVIVTGAGCAFCAGADLDPKSGLFERYSTERNVDPEAYRDLAGLITLKVYDMKKPVICGVIVDGDTTAIKEAEPLVDMFEVRIDLIGGGWQEVVSQLSKHWIACNRIVTEGGSWQGSEARRKEELLKACQLGADIVDIELETTNLERLVPIIKKEAKCLISFHDMERTPPLDELRKIVRRQLAAGGG